MLIEAAARWRSCAHRRFSTLTRVSVIVAVPKLLPPADCTPDHFTCKNGSCLEQWHVCDLVADCAQAEDEKQSCGEPPPTHTPTQTFSYPLTTQLESLRFLPLVFHPWSLNRADR